MTKPAALLVGREVAVGGIAGELPRLAAVEGHGPRLSATVHLDIESLRQGVHDRRADPVQTPRGRIRSAPELASRVELREDDLNAGEPGPRFRVDGDAARPVDDLHAAVAMEDHVDPLAVTTEGLVDGVVDDLPQAVHQTARIGGADVHPGAFPHRFEAFENLQVVGGVLGSHSVQGYPRHHRAPG